jgi:hypothetical protein
MPLWQPAVWVEAGWFQAQASGDTRRFAICERTKGRSAVADRAPDGLPWRRWLKLFRFEFLFNNLREAPHVAVGSHSTHRLR